MILLREGIENDISKFCQMRAEEEKNVRPVDLKQQFNAQFKSLINLEISKAIKINPDENANDEKI